MSVPLVYLDLESMDFSVSPKSSFNKFCNGQWIAKSKNQTNIQDVQSTIEYITLKKLQVIAEDLNQLTVGKSLLSDFYQSGMDQTMIESHGLNPIREQLDDIDVIETKKEFIMVLAELHLQNIYPFWKFDIINDFKYLLEITVMLSQSGLGLRNRDLYINESNSNIIEKYFEYIKDVFCILGSEVQEATEFANGIINLEKRIANYSIEEHDTKDISKIEEMKLEDLVELAPNTYPITYFNTLNIQDLKTLTVLQSDYMFKISNLIHETSLDILKCYLKFHLILHYSPYLPSRLSTIYNNFKPTFLNEKIEVVSRESFIINTIGNMLPSLFNKEFANKFFGTDAREYTKELYQLLLNAFKSDIRSLDWITDDVKWTALQKFYKMKVHFGYLDMKEDYSNLKINRYLPFASNIKLTSIYNSKLKIKSINMRSSSRDFSLPAHSCHIQYDHINNSLFIPAGILQPPLFYPPTQELPFGYPTMNFGMLGSMVARAIIDSFNYICGESVTNWNVNAKDLNDELKSLRITYVAFQKYLENQSNMVLPAHPMFTQQQLFFIAYMQSRRTIVDDQRLDHLLTQLPEFNAAFGVKDVDVMIEYEQ